jgi:alpha-D-ribose 1-methylphosphonate 5-triphosphate synthase subunit PhnH
MVDVQISSRENRTQQVFNALMWSLSYPGRPRLLPSNSLMPFVMIAESLIDLETSFYSSDPTLSSELIHFNAHCLPPTQAMYQFYPNPCPADLHQIEKAPAGTHIHPDLSATLVIGCQFDKGRMLRWTGPGIRGSLELQISGIPDDFWNLRGQIVRYPLGWDIFLVDHYQVVGLPRTTCVEVL